MEVIFTTTSDWIAVISAGIALVSLIISGLALWATITNERKNRELTKNLADRDQELTKNLADRDQELTKKMFQRQGVFELHKVWDEISGIDKTKPVEEDVRKLVNALNLTASIWHHDIILKDLIFSYYWLTFQPLYDDLKACDAKLPSCGKKCNELISGEVTKAYKEMEEIYLKKIGQTKL